ncbi:hypothetical protein KRMM14A1004_39620 [Krasilnikovia sp. MM14-A1004]
MHLKGLPPDSGRKLRKSNRLVNLPIDTRRSGCCDGGAQMPAPLRATAGPAEALPRPPVEDATIGQGSRTHLRATNPLFAAVEGGPTHDDRERGGLMFHAVGGAGHRGARVGRRRATG